MLPKWFRENASTKKTAEDKQFLFFVLDAQINVVNFEKKYIKCECDGTHQNKQFERSPIFVALLGKLVTTDVNPIWEEALSLPKSLDPVQETYDFFAYESFIK